MGSPHAGERTEFAFGVSRRLDGDIWLLVGTARDRMIESVLVATLDTDVEADEADGLGCDFRVERLITTSAGNPNVARGRHRGQFVWRGDRLVASGSIQGVTNVGLQRAPLTPALEDAQSPGVMMGALRGHAVTISGPGTTYVLEGVYRFHCDVADPSHLLVVGVIEGSLIGHRPPHHVSGSSS